MRILILGGSKFQGRRAAEMLAEAGHDVTIFSRRPAQIPGVRAVQGERQRPGALDSLLLGRDYDCVIDNIAFEPGDLEALLPRLKGRAGHYLFISSFVVYGMGTGPFHPVQEEEADLTLATGGGYDVGKRRCESFLKQTDTHLPWTILRFGNIDGPGDPSNRRGFFIDRVRDQRGLLLPSEYLQPFQPLWRDDAAKAAVLAAGNRAAFGNTYNIAGGEIMTLPEWLALLAEVVGVPQPYLLALPMEELRRLCGFAYRLPMPGRPVMDLGRARADLGYSATPVQEWLPETVRWWLKSGLASGFWEHRPQEIAAIRKVRA